MFHVMLEEPDNLLAIRPRAYAKLFIFTLYEPPASASRGLRIRIGPYRGYSVSAVSAAPLCARAVYCSRTSRHKKAAVDPGKMSPAVGKMLELAASWQVLSLSTILPN